MNRFIPIDDACSIFTYEGQEQRSPPASLSRQLALPALYVAKIVTRGSRDQTEFVSVEADRVAFYTSELSIEKLNTIHQHLWLAGQERPARSLTEQPVMGRQIILTEQADLHLLWIPGRIFLKPLPDFLLCHSAWQEICTDEALFGAAAGFLLSYIWLLRRPSDLSLAQATGLISNHITFQQWVAIVRSFDARLPWNRRDHLNVRYRHGELRLNRVNWIYRCCSQTLSLTNFIRGYKYGYYDYGGFISSNLKWLVSTTVYIALVLTAMQVGLATERLNQSNTFQRASFGFTVFAILAPVISIGVVLIATAILVVLNYFHTRHQRKDWTSTEPQNSQHH